ncbi:hypothetical protein LX32DRAFT_428281 [Colletotrichum zoysiae]|uniref:Uncharacterized protein n=1 Tax=Colletotrichum zoysiae TaxID=1216348 RepID=A0AAD9HGG1_9PEZI|nr:hypothetical protein LX32DRAFT_428281 [Colletotrichum zoysiae]
MPNWPPSFFARRRRRRPPPPPPHLLPLSLLMQAQPPSPPPSHALLLASLDDPALPESQLHPHLHFLPSTPFPSVPSLPNFDVLKKAALLCLIPVAVASLHTPLPGEGGLKNKFTRFLLLDTIPKSSKASTVSPCHVMELCRGRNFRHNGYRTAGRVHPESGSVSYVSPSLSVCACVPLKHL